MPRILIACLAALVLSLPAAAQDAPAAGPQVTILNQIDAFRADDYATAFTFAAPNIQRTFRDAQTFERMVRQGYPMVAAPAQVEMLDAVPDGDALVQGVLIRDGAGVFHALEYRMVQIDGVWRIAGVRRIEAPAIGA